jgi:putative endonuclease
MHRMKPSRSSINGVWAEGLAAQHLEDAGLTVTQRNYRVRGGEIDLITLEGLVTVFVEVKQRTRVSHGTPSEYITPRKASLIRRAALEYLGRDDVACRFDAVLIEGDARAFNVTWLKDAF